MTDVSPPLSLARAQRRAPAGAGVPSPCVGVCLMDPASGWCQGCWRTLDEIAAWGRADDATKRAVWLAIEQRQAGSSRP